MCNNQAFYIYKRVLQPQLLSSHILCDRLYFEFIEEMYEKVENLRIIVLDCDKYSRDQKQKMEQSL